MQEWYPVLEYWAQDKANLCLPPTQYEFYDFVVIQKYGKWYFSLKYIGFRKENRRESISRISK